VGGKLSELSDGILLENVAVHLKFISNVLSVNLGKAGLSSEVTAQVLLKVSNNFNSVAVVLEGLNEESVGITSVFRELFSSSFDFFKSVGSPSLPSFKVEDLFFNVFNVSLGSLPVVLVDVRNKSQITNGLGTNSFISLVLSISSNLSFKVFSLKISEEIVN